MGNVLNGVSNNEHSQSTNITEGNEMDGEAESDCEANKESSENDGDIQNRRQEEMDTFKKQLEIKRKQRREILQRHKSARENLEKQLESERDSKLLLYDKNKALRELLLQNNIEIPEELSNSNESEIVKTIMIMKNEFDLLKQSNARLRDDLVKSQSALKEAYIDIAELRGENVESFKQISSLKEVIAACKSMVSIREEQLLELKKRLGEIEKSLLERETQMMSTELKEEYERQLSNIRRLRGLYEERARLADLTRRRLLAEIDEQKHLLRLESEKCENLTLQLATSDDKINSLERTIEDQNIDIKSYCREMDSLKQEMNSINKIFSQMLLGYKMGHDLDKLGYLLKENHSLLTHIAEGDNDNPAALPKMLMKLVNQLEGIETDKNKISNETVTENETKVDCPMFNADNTKSMPANEIIQNLPKVWRVLMELLSHYAIEDANEDDAANKVTTCYKSVDTSSGPILVPSVSQTYTRLKDLIMEKLALVKEVNQMKQLNVHLESRLSEQERKLCLVTTELTKTWHVVSKLRKHHHQLHTHEKILKYELQQKRKLLNGLKVELEYCREKWKQAQEKNCQSEKDWRKLRAEFSSRKTKHLNLNYSAESGFSDDKCTDESSESNDENENRTDSFLRSDKKSTKSFDTDIDSSTDLYAEKEYPTSDMLDVADLSLDMNAEIYEENEFHSLKCDSTSMNAKTAEETSGIIPSPISVFENDSSKCSTSRECDDLNVNEPSSIASSSSNSIIPKPETILMVKDKDNNATSENQGVPNIDPKAILDSIKMQNERLEKKDEKFRNIELKCETVVKKFGKKISVGAEMVEKLDAMHEKYKKKSIHQDSKDNMNEEELGVDRNTEQEADTLCQNIQFSNDHIDEITKKSIEYSSEPSTSTSKENQDEERFAARDMRLKRLEEQTERLVTKVNNTTTKAVKLNYKLEELHNIYGSENSRAGSPDSDNSETETNENQKPSV